jgi:hypothetical protein
LPPTIPTRVEPAAETFEVEARMHPPEETERTSMATNPRLKTDSKRTIFCSFLTAACLEPQ